ncbi:MAG: OB-fold nucleic acid binding domain-containing protein [Kiritimatiellae bacterium]|nr:OB-fold nucleic acid binding domain-containing protein [Kiritimatiellia bacterium]
MRRAGRATGITATLGTEASAKDATCPSCDRFIGPADVCPYCGCDSARSAVYRRLRHLTLGLASAGVLLLLWVACKTKIPTLCIGTITPQMNFALVCVEGRVERDAYISPRTGRPSYVSFALNDGTGQIRVVAHGRVAAELVQKNLVPRKGKQVSATGTLNVADTTNIKLRLRRVTDLIVGKREPENVASSTVRGEDTGEKSEP